MRRWLLLALLALVPGAVYAQRMSSGPHFSGRGVPFRSPHFSGRPGAYVLPLFDPSYTDYAVPPEYPAAQPPVIVVQPQSAPAASVTSVSVQPLTIELRGGHFVKISGDGDSRAELIDEPAQNFQLDDAACHLRRSGCTATRSIHAVEASKRQPLLHTFVLIFRDGHREEVSNYTVADGVLYASADYYNAGAWIRKVPVSELNIPETIAANHSQGAVFRLPTAANEVVVGP